MEFVYILYVCFPGVDMEFVCIFYYYFPGVDMEFEKLLVAIFGQDFIDTFKTHRPAGYVDLMIAFESRKRAATPHKTNPLNVSLPFSFIDYYKKYKVRCYHGIVVTMVTVVCFEMVSLCRPRKCSDIFYGEAIL